MNQFTKDIEELVSELGARKDHLKMFLIKHFERNKDYAITNKSTQQKNHGGHNKEDIFLKPETFDLIKSTYNLKHRYVTKLNGIEIKNPLLMSIETASIGFIQEAFKGVVPMVRQYRVNSYLIDLYIPSIKIAIECDEHGHTGYDQIKEEQRQKHIENKLGCTFIRFNPSSPDFDLANLFNTILSKVFTQNS